MKTLTNHELELLKLLIVDKIDCGGNIGKIRELLKIYDKIDDIINERSEK